MSTNNEITTGKVHAHGGTTELIKLRIMGGGFSKIRIHIQKCQ